MTTACRAYRPRDAVSLNVERQGGLIDDMEFFADPISHEVQQSQPENIDTQTGDLIPVTDIISQGIL